MVGYPNTLLEKECPKFKLDTKSQREAFFLPMHCLGPPLKGRKPLGSLLALLFAEKCSGLNALGSGNSAGS